MSIGIGILGDRRPFEISREQSAFGKELSAMWQRFEAAQTRKAENITLSVLMKMNDDHLLTSGYTPQQIALIRSGVYVPLQYDTAK